MKNFNLNKLTFALILILFSCSKSVDRLTIKDMKVSKVHLFHCGTDDYKEHLKFSTVTNSISNVLDSGKYVFAIPPGGIPCCLSNQDTIPNLSQKRILRVKVYYDQNLNASDIYLRDDIVNAILDKLNMGVRVDIQSREAKHLHELETDGRINTDNIVRDLKIENAFDTQSDFQVYLFDESDFFNTANAITIDYNGQSLIFGDAFLLKEPMLFAHELGHALGLTHNNVLINGAEDTSIARDSFRNMYNLMHESNIGCVRGITARQLLLMHSGEYVKEIENNFYFPEDIDDCDCNVGDASNNFILTDKVEGYINSFDRNIHDSPLVGDHLSFLTHLIDNSDPSVSNVAKDVIKKNYENEYDIYLKDAILNSAVSKSDYTTSRMQTLNRLRTNNVIRWLAENMRHHNISKDTADYAFIKKNFALLDFESLYINRSLEIIGREQIKYCGETPLICDEEKDREEQSIISDLPSQCETIEVLKNTVEANINLICTQNNTMNFTREEKGGISPSALEYLKSRLNLRPVASQR